MTQTNHSEDSIDLKSIEIQVIFNFRKKTKFHEFFKNSILETSYWTLFDTKTSLLENHLILHYTVSEDPDLANLMKTYDRIKLEYSKQLKELSVTNILNKEYLDCEIDPFVQTKGLSKSKTGLIKTIKIDLLRQLINYFIDIIDNPTLEIILSRNFLHDFEAKDLEEFGIYDESFKKLFDDTLLKNSDIVNIFTLTNTNDYLIKKQLIYLILKKKLSSLTPKNFEKKLENLAETYKNSRGKVLFNKEQLKDLHDHLDWNSSLLEMFFKDYYLKISNELRDIELKPSALFKYEIPIDLESYNLNLCGKKAIKEIKSVFYKDTKLFLDTFKRVFHFETQRILGIRLNNLLISFEIKTTTKKEQENAYLKSLEKLGFYYKDKDKLFYDCSKLIENQINSEKRDEKEKDSKIQKRKLKRFILFHGFYQKSESEINLSWNSKFKLLDFNNKTIQCKIVKNKEYFNRLRIPKEAEIICQGIITLHYEFSLNFKNGKFLKSSEIEILDIGINDRFESIKMWFGDSYQGSKYIENTRKGLTIFMYPTTGNIFSTPLLAEPIMLKNIYEGQNDKFYKVTCGKHEIVDTFEGIQNYLEKKTDLVIRGGNILYTAIKNVIRGYREEYNLESLKMYPACGIFDTEEGDLIIAHPENPNIALYGENSVQKRIIDQIMKKGIDWEGTLTKDFYEILHLPTMEQDVRLGVYGYTAIQPFFYAIRSFLDLFANVFLIAPPDCGKSKLLDICANYLYGTKAYDQENIESGPRYTIYATECTFPQNVEDIDKTSEEWLNFIKANSTRKLQRERLGQDSRTLRSEQIYTSWVGSSNETSWMDGVKNKAFRMRCLIFFLTRRIVKTPETAPLHEKYIKHRENIINGKVFGIYLLTKAKEFVEHSMQEDIPIKDKLIALVKDRNKKISDYIFKHRYSLIDSRRETVYSALYIGWEIWKYVFKIYELESTLIDEILDLETDTYINFIKRLENAEVQLTFDNFDPILEFFTKNIAKFEIRENSTGIIMITSYFITAYDEWAARRRYPPLSSITKFGDLQSQILNRTIEYRTRYLRFPDGKKGKKKCIPFYFDEIYELRHGASFYSQSEPKENANLIDYEKDLFNSERKQTVGDLANLLDHSDFLPEEHDTVKDIYKTIRDTLKNNESFKIEDLKNKIEMEFTIEKGFINNVVEFFKNLDILKIENGICKWGKIWG